MHLRSQRTKLLSLPDELLSTVILETMWATTTKPSNPPDLLMFKRRLTKHPARQRKKVAFVGQICRKLRRIAQPHLNPARLWEDPGARVEIDIFLFPVERDAPSSLISPSIRAVACSPGQAIFLPNLPADTLAHLSDLSVSGGNGGIVEYSDDVLRSIGSCKQLQHLAINYVVGSESGTAKLFADIASIPTLRTVAFAAVYSDTRLTRSLSLALGQTWSAPLVRLEVVWCESITLGRFLELMGKVAATLEVAIFNHIGNHTYSTMESCTTVVASFPQLWRLDIGFGAKALPQYRGLYPTDDNTAAGRQQLAQCSPLTVWKAAPRLEYFDCSEQIAVKTQKELDEVGELRKREGMKRLRIRLETWEGDKGVGWSTDEVQELVVG